MGTGTVSSASALMSKRDRSGDLARKEPRAAETSCERGGGDVMKSG